jgi:hypothetical protein
LKILNNCRHRKALHVETQEVIANIVKLCHEEAKQQQLTFPLAYATQIAVTYTGVSTVLIKRIRCQSKEMKKAHCPHYILQENTSRDTKIEMSQFTILKYSRTSNNGHCRGIQILSVIGGVR